VVARNSVPVVELPTECITVEPLGGDVLVRGMDMPQLLRFSAARRRLTEARAGETQPEADERALAELVPLALAMLVLADDGQPLFTETQWRAWGATQAAVALELFAVAMRLSGGEREAEKKT
jgi:hypothetical protein